METVTETVTYEVYTLDVWGNEIDGFDVNDRSHIGTIELVDAADDQELIHALVDADILASFSGRVADRFTIDGDEGYITIDSRRDGRPLLQLERAE